MWTKKLEKTHTHTKHECKICRFFVCLIFSLLVCQCKVGRQNGFYSPVRLFDLMFSCVCRSLFFCWIPFNCVHVFPISTVTSAFVRRLVLHFCCYIYILPFPTLTHSSFSTSEKEAIARLLCARFSEASGLSFLFEKHKYENRLEICYTISSHSTGGVGWGVIHPLPLYISYSLMFFPSKPSRSYLHTQTHTQTLFHALRKPKNEIQNSITLFHI